MTTPTPAPTSSPSVREVLEMLARAIETERDRQKCGVFFSDLAATLDPAHLRALAQSNLAPPPVEEISAEEFARRESPHWAHVENAVEYVRAGRGDPQFAPAPPAGAGAQAEIGQQVFYIGPRRNLWGGPCRVIKSMHGHLTRIARDGWETSVPHHHVAQPQAEGGRDA